MNMELTHGDEHGVGTDEHFFIQHTGSRICYWSLENGVLAILDLNTEC